MTHNAPGGFWERVSSPEGPRGCRLWLLSVDKNGYARFDWGTGRESVHRIGLAAKLGRPIALGFIACHTCPNRHCVEHVYEGTYADNNQDTVKDGNHQSHHRNKTRCVRGHAYTKKSTYVTKDGRRDCRACRRTRALRKRILQDIVNERRAQDARFGVQHHPDGTMERLREHANLAREACDIATERNELTWRHIAEEEFYEALTETDPEPLRVELIQLAAVLVNWIEDIDSREKPCSPTPPVHSSSAPPARPPSRVLPLDWPR